VSRGTSFLGIGGYDYQKLKVSTAVQDYNIKSEDSLEIPVSSLLSSSLSASIILWFSVFSIASIRIVNGVMGVVVWLVPKIDLKKYIFTTATLSLTLVVVVLFGAFEVWGIVWKAVFH
jgi:hypothetical protein